MHLYNRLSFLLRYGLTRCFSTFLILSSQAFSVVHEENRLVWHFSGVPWIRGMLIMVLVLKHNFLFLLRGMILEKRTYLCVFSLLTISV